MKHLYIILLLIFIFPSREFLAQHTVKEISDTFFEKYQDSTDDAFDYLFGTNPWMLNSADAVTNVKFKLRESAALMGKYLERELIREKEVGSSMKTEVFMVKYERQPLRFVMIYYKPRDSWMIYNFSFDEDIDVELK